MKKREFKTESKRVLDLMINSIYTNKEIFLRELISNASDALDKLYYLSLTNKDIKVKKNDLEIKIDLDKEARTLTITDNGCGMTEDELENNLGVIAESGSLHFKEENDGKDDVNIINKDNKEEMAITRDISGVNYYFNGKDAYFKDGYIYYNNKKRLTFPC